MFFDSSAFRVTAFIFILVTAIVTLMRPSIFFDNEGQLKTMALAYNAHQTPLPFGLFIYGFLVITYILITFIESYINKLFISK